MKKMYRSETDKVLCGVCGGIAEYFGIDATLVRLGFAAFSILGGSGLLAYLVAAAIIPRRTEISEM
jgi:phage shock protein C